MKVAQSIKLDAGLALQLAKLMGNTKKGAS